MTHCSTKYREASSKIMIFNSTHFYRYDDEVPDNKNITMIFSKCFIIPSG